MLLHGGHLGKSCCHYKVKANLFLLKADLPDSRYSHLSMRQNLAPYYFWILFARKRVLVTQWLDA